MLHDQTAIIVALLRHRDLVFEDDFAVSDCVHRHALDRLEPFVLALVRQSDVDRAMPLAIVTERKKMAADIADELGQPDIFAIRVEDAEMFIKVFAAFPGAVEQLGDIDRKFVGDRSVPGW